MVSLLVKRNSFDYIVFEESKNDELVWSATRKEFLLKRDLTLVYNASGKLLYTIKHRLFFERVYKVYDPSFTLVAEFSATSISGYQINFKNDVSYTFSPGNWFTRNSSSLTKGYETIGTFEIVSLDYRDAEYKFKGNNKEDLLGIILILLAVDSWGI